MGLFSQILGYREINLGNSNMGAGRALSTGLTPKEPNRIDRTLLEEDYRYDTVTFNIINKQLQMIMQAGFEIKTKRAMNQKFYDDFFEEIGDIGEEITKEELVEYILQDMLMYGNSYVELIYEYGDITKKIVDLKMIPEKRMDYIKRSDGSIAVDVYGRPLGYLMSFSNLYNVQNLGDKIPKQYEGVAIKNSNQVFFLRERIAHFKLHTFGDRNYGIGLIEPAHTSTYRKLLIEEARTNEIYTRGANTIVASVGDIDHEPTTENLNDVLANISNWKHDRYFSFPYWVKLENQAIEQNDAVDKTLEYLRINQAASAGMPMAFATGAGEATNRATLNNQQDILELSLEHVVNKFCASFNKYILKRIAKTNNVKEIAEIHFGEIITEEKNNKSKRLVEAIQSKVIAPEEARDYFLKAEDLNRNDGAYKKFLDEAKKSEEKSSEEKVKKEVVKKDEDSKNELNEISKKLDTNTRKINELELEKKRVEDKYLKEITNLKEENLNDKQTMQQKTEEMSKEFIQRLDVITKEINLKINEKDKIIEDLNKRLSLVDLNSKLTDKELEQLLSEKKVKIINKKQKIIEKLESELSNDK